LFDPVRDANPFFHYMEAIWMLAGEDGVEFPAKFAQNIKNYSDDLKTLHGAYGHRWRKQFEVDQIEVVIDMLKKDRQTRRAVIAMWDPTCDLGVKNKDLPCNTQLYFRVMKDQLHMTVTNRSNDLVWGMLGSNIVHFSILQEYIASATGLELGYLNQFTNNLHVYEGWEDKFSRAPSNWYRSREVSRWRFTPDNFSMLEAKRFVNFDTRTAPTCRILTRNAIPMMNSWNAYKAGEIPSALLLAEEIYDEDWRHACKLWLARRQK
jgi:hypothetical protein